MIKKHKKALTFLITSFALFTVGATVHAAREAQGVSKIECEVGGKIKVECTGEVFITSGDSIKKKSNSEIECVKPGDAVYECKMTKTGLLTGTKQESIYTKVSVKDPNEKPKDPEKPADPGSADPDANKKPVQDTVRVDNSVGGLGSDDGSVIINSKKLNIVNSGSLTGKTKVDGSVCESYTICKVKNASEGHPNATTNKNGYKMGPYLKNQGNLVYNAYSNCGGDKGKSYTSFCLEAQFDGPSNANNKKTINGNPCLDYKATSIDPSNDFQLALFALYKLSESEYPIKDDQTYFEYEAAARILTYYYPNAYQPRSNTGSSSKNNRSAIYRSVASGGAADLIGTAGPQGKILADKAKENADKIKKSSEDVVAGTYGVRINQLGGYTKVGDSYQSMFVVTIQNVSSANELGWGNLKFEYANGMNNGAFEYTGITATQQGNAVYDQGKKTLTYNVLIGGIAGVDAGCTYSRLKVTLSYEGKTDIRSAFMLDAVDDTTKANRQRFVVFVPSNGSISYELPLNNCNTPPPTCVPQAAFNCDNENRTTAVVNEGDANGDGITDWDDCIIHGHDAQGNSYDVVDNSQFERTKTGEYSDNIQGTLSNEEDILDASYCTISCKEKYEFVLPGYKKNVKQGTYFSFHVDGNREKHMVVGINAERACVSSEISNEKYKTRALDLRAQLVDHLNAYLFYRQVEQALLTKSTVKDYAEAAIKKIKPAESLEPDHSGHGCDSNTTGYARSGETLTSGEQLINKTDWKDKNYLEGWDYDNLKVKIFYYKLDKASSLENGNLTKVENVEVNLSTQSLKDVLKKSQTQSSTSNSKGFDFYKNYDESDVFLEKIDSVSGWDENKDLPKEYYHNYVNTHKEWKHHDEQGYYPCEAGCDWVKTADAWDEELTVCDDEIDKSQSKKLKVHVVASQSSELWDKNDIDVQGNHNQQYQKYNDALNAIEDRMQKAKDMFETLIKEISLQNASIQECTNYLNNFNNDTMQFNFDPVITFSYPDQSNYMQMLAPNILENANPEAPTADYKKCTSDAGTDPEALINQCRSGGTSGNPEGEITFTYPIDFSVEKAKRGESDLLDSLSNVQNEVSSKFEKEDDDVTYYNVGRVGSVATYGRTGGYEWYQSATVFYTNPNDGLAVTKPTKNSTIIDTDGRVYPVAINTAEGNYPFYLQFSRIGQFNESGNLGRIMGGGDGKAGTMSGDAYDREVCYYEVTRLEETPYKCPEPNDHIDITDCVKAGNTVKQCEEKYCPDVPTNNCDNLVADKCANGNINELDDDHYEDCLALLLEASCCEPVKDYIPRRNRDAYKGGLMPTVKGIKDAYEDKCNREEYCQSFKIITIEDYKPAPDIRENTLINNDGALQLNARTISTNNMFPNYTDETMPSNWRGDNANSVITEIESQGDGIFAGDPDYHITLTSECLAAIKRYNASQEGSDGGLSNGGFNDYTNEVINANAVGQTSGDLVGKKYGTSVPMSPEFKKVLEDGHCSLSDTKATSGPDTINDERVVES